jgi:hypothetical protein
VITIIRFEMRSRLRAAFLLIDRPRNAPSKADGFRSPKQKDRRQAVLSLPVGVDALDFALAA